MTGMKSSPYERARSRICFLAARSSSGKGARVWEAMVGATPAVNPHEQAKELFVTSCRDACESIVYKALRLDPQCLRFSSHRVGRLDRTIQRGSKVGQFEFLLRNPDQLTFEVTRADHGFNCVSHEGRPLPAGYPADTTVRFAFAGNSTATKRSAGNR